MDTIADPDISFDEKGISNYYYEFIEERDRLVINGEEGIAKLKSEFKRISNNRGSSQYDSILGISGGVDSTYVAYLANKYGLNPLLIHFDYGWNSELATNNIENIVKNTGFDLYTHVMDWEEFKDLQRSYFKASVLDLDVPADHMIFGAVYKLANKYNIKSVLNGYNINTEQCLPQSWNYDKFDIKNLKNIQAKFGTRKLKKLPKFGFWNRMYYMTFRKFDSISPLNWVEYNKAKAKETIATELGWRDYGGKHFESVFTRFYQGYILPRKFKIDKRKAHLSTMIFAGEISKEEALAELAQPPYDPALQQADKEFVAKKLGFTDGEFEAVLSLPNVPHEHYGTDALSLKTYRTLSKLATPIKYLIGKR